MSLLSPLILLLGGSRFFVIGAYSVSLQALILVLSAASSPLAAQDLAAKNIDPAFEQRVLDVIRRNPAALIEALNSYERQQDEAKLREQSVQLQRIYPRPSELIGESPRRGNGKVVLVEFSDFQCPYCAKAHNELVAFIQRHGKGVTFVYKHLPLSDIHPHALPAARAAWAAGRQGKFWAYHDALFANQARLGEPLYEEIATGLKLNQARFNEDRKGTASLQAIQKDLDQAKRLGVRGTPTMVMNQQFLMGPFTLEVLEKQLDQLTISKRSKPRLMNSKEGE
jgi:protein-disulfide isomerase